MIKLLILSDSHGELLPMRRAVRRFSPQWIIHLGDCTRDAERLQAETEIPVLSLRGNCDLWAGDCPETLIREFEGVRIFAVHGHRQGVKSGLLSLCYSAAEAGAQLALFGHTHAPLHTRWGDLELLNPGACGGSRPTCAVAELENGSLRCRLEQLYEEEP